MMSRIIPARVRVPRATACVHAPASPRRWSLALALAAALLSPLTVRAQGWKCVAPADCTGVVPVSSTAAFTLRLEHTSSLPAAGVNVRIRNTDGTLFIDGIQQIVQPDGTYLTKTDQNGLVSGYVTGAKAGQRIQFNAAPSGAYQEFTVQVASAPLELDPEFDHLALYVGSQLRDVTVFADGLAPDACRKSVVRFSPRGNAGSVSVDSAFGEPTDGRCAYTTDWRLGTDVGRQVLQVRNGFSPPAQIEATARRRSTLRVGLAGVYRRGNISNIVNTRAGERIHVQRPGPDGTVIEYDSVPRAEVVKPTAHWEPEAIPFILLDTPLRPGWERVRVAIGASAINVRRDFFAGFSVGQAWWGLEPEDVGFDAQFGLLFSRPDRLENAPLCERDLADADLRKTSCKTTNDLRFDGWGVTFSTDAQGLVTSIGKMLGFS